MLEKSDSLDLVIQVCDIFHGQRQQFVHNSSLLLPLKKVIVTESIREVSFQ